MTDSQITHHNSGTSLTGPDAMAFARAIYLKKGIELYVKTGIKMTRMATPTFLLQSAASITGKSYKRGQYQAAISDLHVWIETMRAALPSEDLRFKEYTVDCGESLMGIALRQLKNDRRWEEIREMNKEKFPDMGPHDYYPVGTTIKIPAQ